MDGKVKIIGAAFGDPMSETVFSGVSRYLFRAMEKRSVMCGYASTKQLRPWDVFDGMVDLSKTFQFGRPGISGLWMWRRSTIDKLTARFMKKLDSFGHFDAVLQVGTHAIVESKHFKHYVFTDMTIAQVVTSPYAGDFAAGKLPSSQHSEAIEAQRDIFQSCEGIFVNSTWTKNSIVNDYGINAAKVHVVGAGVSLPLDNIPGKKENSHDILFIGRDWRHKGGPILLEALELVRKKFDDATVTVIGCNPRVGNGNVRVLGALDKRVESDRRLIENALARAGVLCVPSVFEAYGICFLEAQLYRVPPITFAGEGRDDAIKHGTTGLLLRERTPEALSEAIVELFSNPDKARKMGDVGHEFVTRNLTWDHVAGRVLRVIEKQIDQ